MAQWYVKDLSKLTGVSVQTLHHYDRISLLKPSLRLANGYRLYSEKDLLKLQQIVSLKFFGFELAKIKKLLAGNVDMHENFSTQAKFLEEKANTLMEASHTLKRIIAESNYDKSIPWETIIKLIEVYRMVQQLEKTWAGEVFTADELKQYANFEAEKYATTTAEVREKFTQNWVNLIDQVRVSLDVDPTSSIATDLAKQILSLVTKMYGKKHANLRHTIWEKGFKQGKMDGVRALEPEVVEWLDKAMSHYYRERIYHLLDQIELGITPTLQERWDDLMSEMFGDSKVLKQSCYSAGEGDPRVGTYAKKWLKQFIE